MPSNIPGVQDDDPKVQAEAVRLSKATGDVLRAAGYHFQGLTGVAGFALIPYGLQAWARSLATLDRAATADLFQALAAEIRADTKKAKAAAETRRKEAAASLWHAFNLKRAKPQGRG